MFALCPCRCYSAAMSDRQDVLILGGGLIGRTLALALDVHGITSTVVDPVDPESVLAPDFDGRASAIASATWRMFEAIGLADALRPAGCPIARIEVRDGLQARPLAFTPTDGESLGTMVENRRLRAALHEATLAAANVTLRTPGRALSVERKPAGVTATLASGEIVRADLLVVAEGRRSPTRDAAGIRMARWQYDGRAIVTAFEHTVPHGGVAHEIFYPDGPFALLPMQSGTDGLGRSALVWTVLEKNADGMLALSDGAFTHEAAKRAGGLLGALRLIAPRQSWPLGFHAAARLTAERLVLVGDAGHGIHPIAGQGLNLGLRDVAALVEVLVEGIRLGLDPGDAQLLNRYARWRALDTLAIAAATDGLTRLFGIPGGTARSVRRFGMGVVERTRPLKDFFMAEARGETGKLPRLLTGALV